MTIWRVYIATGYKRGAFLLGYPCYLTGNAWEAALGLDVCYARWHASEVHTGIARPVSNRDSPERRSASSSDSMRQVMPTHGSTVGSCMPWPHFIRRRLRRSLPVWWRGLLPPVPGEAADQQRQQRQHGQRPHRQQH